MESVTRYAGLKSRAVDMSGYLAEVRQSDKSLRLKKAHIDLQNCANHLVFHDYFTIGETRLVKAFTCKKHLLCPFCAARRAAKLLQANLPKFEAIVESNPHLIPVMITLTVKNGFNLAERFAHLNNSFRKLLQRRRDAKKGKSETVFSKVEGGAYSIETTNKLNGWHPHIHIIAFLSDYIGHAELSREWNEITGDSFVVGIQKIKTSKNNPEIVDAALEVFKYAVKFSELELDKNFQAFDVLSNRRLIGSFGILRGMQIPDNLLDESLDDLPYVELIYKFNFYKRIYDLERKTEFESPSLSALNSV